MEYYPTNQEKKAIEIMRNEAANYQQGSVFVTDKVHYNMRDVIQKSRKNYLGIYYVEKDEITQKKKV